MDFKKIEKLAKNRIEGEATIEAVEVYIDLLKIKTSSEKQLKEINKRISEFKKNPEEFCNDCECLW